MTSTCSDQYVTGGKCSSPRWFTNCFGTDHHPVP